MTWIGTALATLLAQPVESAPAPAAPATGPEASATEVQTPEVQTPRGDEPEVPSPEADDQPPEDDAAPEAVAAAPAAEPTPPAPAEPAPAQAAPAPSEPGPAAPAQASAPPPNSTAKDERPERPRFARLGVVAGPVIGPHAVGNQECRQSDQQCVTSGGFFGAGMSAELRVKIVSVLGAHVRGLLVGNATPKRRDPLYSGLGGAGIGIGAYGRRAFVRGEYLFVAPFGKERFTPPFHTEATASDRWGNHAGLFSFGFRQPFAERWAVELWGGPMIGPKSVREVPPAPAQTRILPTFLVGINIGYDIVR